MTPLPSLFVSPGAPTFALEPGRAGALLRDIGQLAAEFAGGVALILGIWPRAAAFALAPMTLGTIVTVHGKAGFFFDSPKGGWEYPAFWSVSLLVLALAGDGAWALLPTQTLFQLIGL